MMRQYRISIPLIALMLSALLFFFTGCDNGKKKKKEEMALIAVILSEREPVPDSTIYVSPAGSDWNDGLSWGSAVRTIQKGIDRAGDNSTIIVADGTYTGNGNINLDFDGKALHLKSENGPENCIIDCMGLGRAFHFHNMEDNNSVVEGFAVTGGFNADLYVGSAILCDDSSPVIINCRFTNNKADLHGGAVFCNYASPVIMNCTFRGNESGSDGGGLYCDFNSNLSIINCTFENNTAAYYGGGLYCRGSTAEITNCIFTKNEALHEGGGAACWGASASITNCVFDNNTADGGGGIFCAGGSFLKVTNCTLSYNNANVKGGTSGGGGVLCGAGTILLLRNCIIWNNFTNQDGSQLYIHDPAPGIPSTVFMNSCCYDDSAGHCGGNASRLTLDSDCIFTDPLFEPGALTLSSASPCIDAGKNTYIDEVGITADLLGLPRKVDGIDPWDGPIVDIGAYEHQP